MGFLTNSLAVGATVYLGGAITAVPFLAIGVVTYLFVHYVFGIADLFPFGCVVNCGIEGNIFAPVGWLVLKLYLYGALGSAVLAIIWGLGYTAYDKITTRSSY